jgi:ketosteroid isomerase-like protein
MAQENVELMQTAFEEFARGDFSRWEELGDEFEFVTTADTPDAGTYRGEAARRWLRSWLDAFEELVIEGTEFIDAGDKVVIGIHQRGTPRGSRVPVEGRWWQVTTIRDGELVRVQVLGTREEALDAAEL